MSLSAIQVIAAVISRGDRFMICQRSYQKRHGGLWEFPGGKCEPGESISDTAQRELREELSVAVIEVGAQELALSDPGSPFLIIFTPVTISGEPTCNEHIAIQWLPLEELLQLPLAPTDRKYVEYKLVRRATKAEPF